MMFCIICHTFWGTFEKRNQAISVKQKSEVSAKNDPLEFTMINNAYRAKIVTNIEYWVKISEQRTSSEAC